VKEVDVLGKEERDCRTLLTRSELLKKSTNKEKTTDNWVCHPRKV
jgi:hypothetical protein